MQHARLAGPGGHQHVAGHLSTGVTQRKSHHDDVVQRPVTRSPQQWWFCFSGHVLCRTGAPDEPGYQPSRPYLEAQVRKRVRGLGNVVLRGQCDAGALVASDARDRVTGVRVAPQDGDEETPAADLVVDATGRIGRTPAWLQQLGYAARDEERVVVDVMYASRQLRLRPGALGDVKLVLVGAELSARPVWRCSRRNTTSCAAGRSKTARRRLVDGRWS